MTQHTAINNDSSYYNYYSGILFNRQCFLQSLDGLGGVPHKDMHLFQF